MTDPTHDGILFGAAYYHEYQPSPRLDDDLDLMVEAGFTVIRVGESVWSTWEPEEGEFDLDWLQPVLDGAHARGISVMLGTPTYAIPMWMKRLYPEIAADSATGTPVHWGARQEVDITHAAFRFYAERIIRRIVARYRDHPAVVGFQVDNEPGFRLLYNTGVFQRFVDSLRHTYGDVETLNREWGLVYWSHKLSTWADLWVPDGNFQPQYDLAWRRFQAKLVTEFIGWQADIVRELARDDQYVTTCISYDQMGVEDVDLAGELDVASGNAYYEMQDSLGHPSTAPRSASWILSGTWSLYELADRMYSSKQAPFLVTETNASSIGHSSLNFSPYDGQWRQAAWALVARGARMIEYWHWHTLHFGTETYWGGVLPHSQIPGRTYAELATLGAEFAKAGPLVAAAVPQSDIAFVYDTDSAFALSSQAPFQAPGSYFDTDSYRRILAAFTRGAFDAKLQSRFLRPQQLFPSRGALVSPAEIAAEHPVLVVAALFTPSDADLDWLAAYAAAGGHLVLGPRSAYADREGRARLEVKPARLDAAAGAWYDEFANLTAPLPVHASGDWSGAFPEAATGIDWVDLLNPAGADVLVSYEHPHFGRWPAMTTRAHDAGRVTMVGTVPDQAFAKAVAGWLVPTPVAAWDALPESVHVSTSITASGTRIHIVHNWSFEPAEARFDGILTNAITDETLDTGPNHATSVLRLGPWDVAVLIEEKAAVQ